MEQQPPQPIDRRGKFYRSDLVSSDLHFELSSGFISALWASSQTPNFHGWARRETATGCRKKNVTHEKFRGPFIASARLRICALRSRSSKTSGRLEDAADHRLGLSLAW